MHIISYIEVKNFRSIFEQKFNLSSYTPLIGYNNAGKSNIIQAIKWFTKPFSLSCKSLAAFTSPSRYNLHIS